MRYIVNSNQKIVFENCEVISIENVVDAINFANEALLKLNKTTQEFDINIFETLGMRNLSGLVGEYFARSLVMFSEGNLQSNLHQDGYPDLLLTNTEEKRKYFATLYTYEDGKKHPISKEVFSPYKYGGIEIKATCGSVPKGTEDRPKPVVGEQRVSCIESFDWKAHHRETNHLLAILWDFINGNPTIVACFYQDNLETDDWTKIVQPKKGGGRTTSVSIMKQKGVKKMCQGWVAVLEDRAYVELFSKKKWIGYKVQQK